MTFLEHQSEVFKQFGFISSLLAGFSFAVVFQLLISNDQRKIVNWVLGIILLASSFLITATIISSIVVYSSGGYNASPYYLNSLRVITSVGYIFFYIGVLSFLLGMGISGWLKSRIIGILSTSIVTACGIALIVSFLILRGPQ